MNLEKSPRIQIRKKRQGIKIFKILICLELLKATLQAPIITKTQIVVPIKSEYTYPTSSPLKFESQTNLINTTSTFILIQTPTDHLINELDSFTLKIKNSITVQSLYRGKNQIKQVSDTMMIVMSSIKDSSDRTKILMKYFNPSNLGQYTTVVETKKELSEYSIGVDSPKIYSYGVDDEYLLVHGKHLSKYVKVTAGTDNFQFNEAFKFLDSNDPPSQIHGVAKMKDYFVITEVYLGKMVRVWLTDQNLARIAQKTTPIYAVEDVATIQNGLDCFSELLKTCVFVFSELRNGEEIKSHLYFIIDVEYKKFEFGEKSAVITQYQYKLKAMNIVKNTPFVFLLSENNSNNLEINLGFYSPEEEKFYEKLDWDIINDFKSANNYISDSIILNPNPFSIYVSSEKSYQRYEILGRNKGCFDTSPYCQGCSYIDEQCEQCIFQVEGKAICTKCNSNKQPVKEGLECGCADGKYYLKSSDRCLDCGANVKKCNPHDLSIINCFDTFIKKPGKNECQCPIYSKINDKVLPKKCECQGMADLTKRENILDFSNLCTCDREKAHVLINTEGTCTCGVDYRIKINEASQEKFCDGICNFTPDAVEENKCRKCDNVDKILCNCKGDYKENSDKTKCEIECPVGQRINQGTHKCENCPEGFRSNLEGFDCVEDDDKNLRLSGSFFVFKKSLIVLKFNQRMKNPETTVEVKGDTVKNGLFKQGILFSFVSQSEANKTISYQIRDIKVSKEDSKSIEIEVTAKPPTPDSSMILIPKSEKGFISDETNGVYINNITVSIPKNESFFDISEKGVRNIRSIKDILLPIASFLSFTSVIALAKIIQVFDYLLLIEIPLPPRIENFFALIDSNLLEMINLDDALKISEDGLECQTTGIWAELEYSCYVWNNSSWDYIAILLVCLIVVIFTVSYNARKKKQEAMVMPSSSRSEKNTQKLIDAVLDKLSEFFNISLIYLVLDAVLIDVGISCFLNLFMKIFGKFFEVLNSCIAFLTLILYIYIDYRLIRYIYLRYKVKKSRMEEKEIEDLSEKFKELSDEKRKKEAEGLKLNEKELETWKFLTREIKDDGNLIVLSVLPILISRDLLIAFSVAVFQKNTVVQILGIFIPQVLALIFVVTEKPFSSKREQFFIVGREIFFSLTLMIFFYIAVEDLKDFEDNLVLEFMLILTIGGIVLTAILMVIINIIILMFKLLGLLVKTLCCFYCCFDKIEDEVKQGEKKFEIKDIQVIEKNKNPTGEEEEDVKKKEAVGDMSLNDSDILFLKEKEGEDDEVIRASMVTAQLGDIKQVGEIKNKRKMNKRGYRTWDVELRKKEIEENVDEDFDGEIKVKMIDLFPEDFIEED